ncbi:MAG: nitrous oxide reductase family maturation protein NosD [Gemmatimonadales bacterium]
MSITVSSLILAALQTSTIVVGAGAPHQTIAEALAAAQPGDTIRVAAGTYAEHIVLDIPVVLIGERGAVLDGSNEGTVVIVEAGATISGFTIRNTGADQSREDAGIMAVKADSLRIENNTFEGVLFGIYIKESDALTVVHNMITGKDIPISLRGDGIRLWYCRGGTIADNTVVRSRDVVIWFSDSTGIFRNHVADSRYGLHYMYSDHNIFEDNEFIHNSVGAFIMYSNDITFRRNIFADARGTTGRGLGFKDTDSIVAERNVLVRNSIGISIDNSPTTERITNVFRNNTVALNDLGVSLLPSVHSNEFVDNDFAANVQPVAVTGGGTALANHWYNNYWSDYAGFDADRDGNGDTPFIHARLSDDLLAKHEALRLFELSPAAAALNMLSRVLPLLEPAPLVIDSAPKMARGHETARRRSTSAGTLAAALISLASTLVAIRIAWTASRPGRSTT